MERWVAIQNTDNMYEVSSYGKVRSVNRIVKGRDGISQKRKGMILSPGLDKDGYKQVVITANSKRITRKIHILVAEAYYGFIPNNSKHSVIDHKDEDKQNNKLSNLQILTIRQNSIKSADNKTGYVGVSKVKPISFKAQIRINGKIKHIGTFDTPKEAHKAYMDVANSL